MQYVKHRVRERGIETWKKIKCEEVCVEENRDKGEIKKTKGQEKVAEKKKKKKKKRKEGVVLVICVVWGNGMKISFCFFKVSLWKEIINYIRVMLYLKYFYNKF